MANRRRKVRVSVGYGTVPLQGSHVLLPPDRGLGLAIRVPFHIAQDHENDLRTGVNTCFQPAVKADLRLRNTQVLARKTHRLFWGAVTFELYIPLSKM